MTQKVVRSIELFFQEQPSDKVYNAKLLETDKGYTVAVEWGRRGAKLNSGTKAIDVPLAKAEKAYDKVVKQKQRKGYEVLSDDNLPAEVAPEQGQGSASKAGIERRGRVGPIAQLLNNADGDALDGYFADAEIVAQQKLDGMRLLVHVRDEGIVATNRDGQETSLGGALRDACALAPKGTSLDGELLVDPPCYWVFDTLAWAGEDLRQEPYAKRHAALKRKRKLFASPLLELVPLAKTEADKRSLFATLQAQRAEGIVFKRKDAPYISGRPPSGGTQLKYKFVKTADVFITANAGNAYQMAVYDDAGKARQVGKVFAGTTNDSRADLDAMLSRGETPVAEVRYLYATKDDILYQPVFVRARTDKAAEACVLSQLEYTDRSNVAKL
ncbi:ATP-dependent DNA ligase [Plesiocystis pacifica SIR-1]|uniref:ATP-dependent DNA ligase n=1 Tax=Plesiocystis pacifica SIR-1 TaxID=391625 RepID=A6FY59_9BACT|nr:WGR domain-containing protein [Plesiocystis pacifica]EDM81438.1 ATP-dependent DNA ligase [Plesiocystis pacifica SIR-1]